MADMGVFQIGVPPKWLASYWYPFKANQWGFLTRVLARLQAEQGEESAKAALRAPPTAEEPEMCEGGRNVFK